MVLELEVNGHISNQEVLQKSGCWDFLGSPVVDSMLPKIKRLHASNAGEVGLILGQGTKIAHAVHLGHKILKI